MSFSWRGAEQFQIIIHHLVEDVALSSVPRGAAVQKLVLPFIDHQLAASQAVNRRFVTGEGIQRFVPG